MTGSRKEEGEPRPERLKKSKEKKIFDKEAAER